MCVVYVRVCVYMCLVCVGGMWMCVVEGRQGGNQGVIPRGWTQGKDKGGRIPRECSQGGNLGGASGGTQGVKHVGENPGEGNTEWGT